MKIEKKVSQKELHEQLEREIEEEKIQKKKKQEHYRKELSQMIVQQKAQGLFSTYMNLHAN